MVPFQMWKLPMPHALMQPQPSESSLPAGLFMLLMLLDILSSCLDSVYPIFGLRFDYLLVRQPQFNTLFVCSSLCIYLSTSAGVSNTPLTKS
ncbi:hypothetical protein EXN66_Car000011 [Channa argus]|uniref:Uncharacterized protein n=1 Tax=Channa argus TaxID=215402 RepID=A0A6G1QVW7_CHAAH|nr:hypothetical protein EXN66_Car000011 [Channa argus]